MTSTSSSPGQRIPFTLALLAVCASMQAQLNVTPQTDLQQLAASITGPGVQISNPQLTCHALGYGEFTFSGSALGADEGVLLTTGRITDAPGPNNNSGGSNWFAQNTSGDAVLDAVTGRSTRDACKFEFDIIPTGDSLSFNFVFASEEYNEWVGSQYNDVFGFFISGPGIVADPNAAGAKNIALIPGSNQPVTINNVNNGSNATYYEDNTGGPEIQYDGFTRNLVARSAVSPCQTYHLKLVIADASDRKYDSGVFIEKIASNNITMAAYTQSGGPDMVEGCNPGWVRFTRPFPRPTPLTIPYYIQGTAINGTDYTAIAPTSPLAAKSITIPANQTHVDRAVNPVADALNEPTEHLLFILGNPLCPSQALDTIAFNIVDTLIATVQPLSAILCEGDSVQFHITGGLNFTWNPLSGVSDPSGTDPWVLPASTTNYSVTVSEGTCTRTVTRLVRVSKLALSAVVTPPLCAGDANGAINLEHTGGIAPYTYSWTGPNGFIANTQDITNLAPGTYTVFVTDAACTRTQSFNVIAPAALTTVVAPSILAFGQNIACNGASTGSIDATIGGGSAPYAVSWTGPNGYASSTADLSGLAAGAYTLSVTDANGCLSQANTTLTQPQPMTATITTTAPVICAGSPAGSATVAAIGGIPPYTYAWASAPAQTTANATGLAAGNYPVTVTDAYGCSALTTATIAGPTLDLALVLSAQTNVSCFGGTTGSATIGISGGTAPYTTTWNTAPVQSTTTATNLTAGTWTATVIDANGCPASQVVNITQPASGLTATLFAQTDVNCFGANNGSATVNVTGGTGPYTYLWNTTPAQNTATATNLGAGTFTCLVADLLNCQVGLNVTIGGPGAPLTSSITAQVDVLIFGQSTGSATVSVNGGVPPYQTTWSTAPPQTGTTATGLAAGSYTVLVTDAAGCTSLSTATITQPGSALTTTITAQSDVACHGDQNGSATVDANGGVPPYSYVWNTIPVQTTATATGLGAGSWSVTVTDANGASSNSGVFIGGPVSPLSLAAVQVNDPACPGSATGQATVVAMGGTAPYTYAWNTQPLQTGATAVGLANGTFTATVTDAFGCTAQTVVTFAGPTIPLSITIDAINDVLCYDDSTGSAIVSANGGTGPYTYTWNTSPTVAGDSLGGVPSGTYAVVATDANGCITGTNVTITQPVVGLYGYVETYQNESCFGANDGWANVELVGGSGSYTATWNTLPPQTGTTATGLGAGLYLLTVTDNNGCDTPKLLPVTIGGPVAPVNVNAVISDHDGFAISCPGGSNGSIDITISGGTAPYFHTWTDDFGGVAGTEDLTGLDAGTYHLVASDANGCTVLMDFTLNAPPAITTSATIITAACQGSSTGAIDVTITGGTAPYATAWAGPNGFTATTEDLSALFAGVHTITVTDAHGCVSEMPFDVSEPGLLSITGTTSQYTGGVQVSCAGAMDGSIDASVGGGTAPYTYDWNGPSGTSFSSEDISGVGAGTYTLAITDLNGCASLATFTLNGPDAIVTGLQQVTYSGSDLSCANSTDGAINATVNGGVPALSFAWSGPNGFVSTSEDIGGLGAGLYTLTVTDVNGCTATDSITLVAPDALSSIVSSPTYNSGDNVSCGGATDGSIDLSWNGGTGFVSVLWSGPNGFSSADPTPGGLAPGTYTALLTDVNGCTTSASVTLTAPMPTTLTGAAAVLPNGMNTSCSGSADGSIDITLSGGASNVTYQWTGPNAFTATSEDITGLTSGTYSVTTIDDNGCIAQESFVLTAPPTLQATSTAISTSCFGTNSGAIDLNVTGGTAPYTLLWSGPAAFSSTSEDITALYAGPYVASITDASGCLLTYAATVTEPGTFAASAILGIQPGGFNVSCAGASDGSIDVTVTGGTGPYYYQWIGPNGFGSISEDLSGLMAGTYNLLVNDQNGCGTLFTYALTEPTPVAVGLVAQVFAGGANTGCTDSQDGQIEAVVTGGIQPYQFSWTGTNGYSAGAEDLSGLDPGTYVLTVTDAIGCANTDSITLIAAEPLVATPDAIVLGNGANLSCNTASDGSIDLSITGGAQPYTVQWSGPSGYSAYVEDPSGLAPGTYSAVITDLNGCTTSTSVQLTAPPPIDITLTASLFGNGYALPCQGSTAGTLSASVIGGSSNFTYSWTGPNGFSSNAPAITGLSAGLYTLTVTDDAGCTATATQSLSEPTDIAITGILSDAGFGYAVGCQGNDGAIAITVIGGTAPYVFDWTGDNGFAALDEDLSGLVPGTYLLSLTDANGCTLSQDYILDQPAPLQATALVSGTICNGIADGAIDLNVTGGTGPYAFAWSGSNGFGASTEDLSGLSGGLYDVVITDAMNCTTSTSATLLSSSTIALNTYVSGNGSVNIPCQGDSSGVIALNLTGGAGVLDVQWSGPNGFTAQSAQLSGLLAGTYSVLISDSNGCSIDTTITLTEPQNGLGATLSASTTPSGTNISCWGGSDGSIDAAVIGGTAPYLFDWRGPDSTSYATEDISGLVAGTYDLVIVDANQCATSHTITLTEPDSAITVNASISAYPGGYATSCATSMDASIDLQVYGGNGAYTYAWTGPGSYAADSASISGLAAGTYQLIITDMNGCLLNSSYELMAPQPITIQLDPTLFPGGTAISCFGAMDGGLSAMLSGGVPGFDLLWTGPNGFTSTADDISGLGAGTYCVIATDTNGCTVQSCTDLIAPSAILLDATSTAAACGDPDGTIDLVVTGGSGPFTYAWSNVAATEDLVGLVPGSYSVQVTDANGCSADTAILVDGSATLSGEAILTPNLCAEGEDGSIDVTVLTGTAPYSFTWSTGATSEDITGLTTGSYTLMATDANGCEWTATYEIAAPGALTVDSLVLTYGNGYNLSAFQSNDGMITVTPQGGASPYTFLWSTGATTAQVNSLAAGTYTVTITDANGCSLLLVFTLDQPATLAMPTGFSPNGDGANDSYFIQGLDAYPGNQLVVFNRWGNVVYERLNYKNDWSGDNSQGEQLPDGTYFVILRIGEGASTLQNYVDLRR